MQLVATLRLQGAQQHMKAMAFERSAEEDSMIIQHSGLYSCKLVEPILLSPDQGILILNSDWEQVYN